MTVITLTTDFGMDDWFVGTIKGVILRLAPEARIVDLTHEIPAGSLRAGAFALMAGYSFFAKGTIHVAVVDPGVGSGRRAIAVQTARYYFIGPDNGVLSFALRHEKIVAVRELANDALFLKPVSRTFHGRDLFAPVAARLARGLAFAKLGPPVQDPVRLPWPELRSDRNGIAGEVVHVDRFGNLITNIDAEMVRSLPWATPAVVVKGRRLCAVAECYAAVPAGDAVAVVGSSGLLEIAVHRGSAATQLGLTVGSPIKLRAD
jgi:S-adenosyl-L-methionine hydrolase (adenosine-forming)